MSEKRDLTYSDLNEAEKEEYDKLTSETLKKEYLAKKTFDQNKEADTKQDDYEPTEDPTNPDNEPEPEKPDEYGDPSTWPYPTYGDEQKSIEENKWIPLTNVDFILVWKKLYKCNEHPEMNPTNRGAMAQHLQSKHQIDLAGNHMPEPPKRKTKAEIERKDNENQLPDSHIDGNQLSNSFNDENQLHSSENQLSENNMQELGPEEALQDLQMEISRLEKLKLEKQLEIQNLDTDTTPEQLVMQDYNAEIARGATKLVQNTDLRFLYERTKTIFPPEWDFATWITALVVQSLNNLHIGSAVWIDESLLDDQQMEYLIKVKQDWKTYIEASMQSKMNQNSKVIATANPRID